MPTIDLDTLLAFASQLADAAGEVIRPYFRKPLVVSDKADLSPVTAADRAAEETMRRLIEARFPGHGILGEEFGRVREDAEFAWVLDPIDGTKSFISGIPLFGTLIALTRKGHPILGIIDQPVLRERWTGAAGRPTTLNGVAIGCRACPSLAAECALPVNTSRRATTIVAGAPRIPCLRAIFSAGKQSERRLVRTASAGYQDAAVGGEIETRSPPIGGHTPCPFDDRNHRAEIVRL